MAGKTTHYNNWRLKLAKEFGKKWKTGRWFETHGMVHVPSIDSSVRYTKVFLGRVVPSP